MIVYTNIYYKYDIFVKKKKKKEVPVIIYSVAALILKQKKMLNKLKSSD